MSDRVTGFVSQRSTPAQDAAYHAGKCKWCLTAPHRAGGTECPSCWQKRGRGETMKVAEQ